MSRDNTPSCSTNPSRLRRQMQAEQCRQPINTTKECLRNMNTEGNHPMYSFASRSSFSPCAVKSRPLNIAMEVERDKCIAAGHNRVPVEGARCRSNSAEGRPFDPNRDLSYNQAPNAFSATPTQLKGRPLNLPMEVERGRRQEIGQRNTEYSQYNRLVSDSKVETAASNKSNKYGAPSGRRERLIGKSKPATKTQTPRTSNIPETKSPHWPSRSIHSSPIRQRPDVSLNDSYPPTGGNTITRTTITRTTTRSIPPQSPRYYQDNSLLDQHEQPNKSLDVDVARQQLQIPTDIAAQSLMRTPQAPFSISSLTSHAVTSPGNVFQNTMPCPIEFEEPQLQPPMTAATDTSYAKPLADSTHFEDTDDQKYSRGQADNSHTAPHKQTYNVMMTSQRPPELEAKDQTLQHSRYPLTPQRIQCPQSTFIDRTREETVGNMATEDLCTEENQHRQNYLLSKTKRAMDYNAPRLKCPQSTCLDRTRNETIGPMEMLDLCTEENQPPQKYSMSKTKRTMGPPSDLIYSTYEGSVQSPPTHALNVSKDCSRNPYSLANAAGPTDPQPTAVCPPCPPEMPIAALFRSLANKFSSTFAYLSSFVTSQNSTDATAANHESFHNYGVTRPPGTWEACGRTSYPMTPQLAQCPCYNTRFNDNRNRFHTTQCHKDYDFSSPQLLNNSSRRHDVPQSVRECAEAKRCGRIQLDASDKYEAQNTQLSQIRKTQMENLVLDKYCPGLIQETIDGIEDFNDTSFNLIFGPNAPQLDDDNCTLSSSQEPMTLLEAFALRIDKEQNDINQKLQEDATEAMINDTFNDHFASAYPSELNRSIKSLLLSERMAERNQMETAKTSSLNADVERKTVSLELLDVPVKLVTYIGRTSPAE